MRTNGIGTKSRAQQPNTVDAHRGFRRSYILVANSCYEKDMVSWATPSGYDIAV